MPPSLVEDGTNRGLFPPYFSHPLDGGQRPIHPPALRRL